MSNMKLAPNKGKCRECGVEKSEFWFTCRDDNNNVENLCLNCAKKDFPYMFKENSFIDRFVRKYQD